MSSLSKHKTLVSGVKVPYSHCILDTFSHFLRVSRWILQIQIVRVAVILTVNRLQKLSGFCCFSSRDFWSNGFIVGTCKQVYCSSNTLPPTALFLTPADPLLKRWAFVFALSCFCPLFFPLSVRLSFFPPLPFAARCSASRRTETRSVPRQPPQLLRWSALTASERHMAWICWGADV